MVITPQEIRVGPAVTASSKEIEVPIGPIDSESTVVVTIGFNKSHFNKIGVDADPKIGITDGTISSSVWIVDHNNYATLAPCYSTTLQNAGNTVSSAAMFPSTFKITFDIGLRYGYCETAQDGGYLNVFNIDELLDLSKPLSLEIDSNNADEVYPIKYINVDIF